MANRRQIAISAAGAALLAAAYIWRAVEGDYSLAALFVGAALSVLLLICFVTLVETSECALTSDGSLSPDAALGARSLRRARRHPWGEIAMFMLLTRIALFVVAYIAYYAMQDKYPGGLFDTLRTVWLRTDSPSYLGISENWYVTEGDPRFHIVFFPFYPIVTALFNNLTQNSFASAMIVSNLSAFGAAILAYETAALDMDRAAALRAVKYLFIFPASFFFASPMTESLFLLLMLASVFLIRKRRWLFGCILAALAGFTRNLGGLLLVFALFEWLTELTRAKRLGTLADEKKKLATSAACLLIIPLGLVGYLLINYFVTGDAFTFMRYQSEHWGQGFGFFFESAATQFDYLVRGAGNGELAKVLGLWIPNLLCTFGALALVTAAAKKLRASYVAFFLVYFVVACGATWLLSSPRYLVAAFPAAFAAAELTGDRRRDAAATVISLVLLFGYLFMYANGMYVY